MKILIIDNYDSFTYNLYQYVGEILEARGIDFVIDVKRNDEISLQQVKENNYDRIIISPGPGDPSDEKYFGVCSDVIKNIGTTTPVLGVCLGMQGIGHCFLGKVLRSPLPMHGKTSKIEHDEMGIFKDLPQNLEVMRYHSLIIDPASLPDCLEVSARAGSLDSGGEIMGLRHKEYPIEGIQFHPESFATEGGKIMLSNFLNI